MPAGIVRKKPRKPTRSDPTATVQYQKPTGSDHNCLKMSKRTENCLIWRKEIERKREKINQNENRMKVTKETTVSDRKLAESDQKSTRI